VWLEDDPAVFGGGEVVQGVATVVRPSAVLGFCVTLFAPTRIRSGAYPMDIRVAFLIFAFVTTHDLTSETGTKVTFVLAEMLRRRFDDRRSRASYRFQIASQRETC
jgi:hypothetical protein